MNPMRAIRVEKVTLNMGVGAPGEEMEKARSILESVAGARAVALKAKKRLPKWGIRPGLEIGLKTTLRKKKALAFLERALQAKDRVLARRSFDRHGNLGFGIHEHIDLPGVKYDPQLGIRGLDVLVTLERPGYRVKRRKQRRAKVGKKHAIQPEEAIAFFEQAFGVKVEDQAGGQTP